MDQEHPAAAEETDQRNYGLLGTASVDGGLGISFEQDQAWYGYFHLLVNALEEDFGLPQSVQMAPEWVHSDRSNCDFVVHYCCNMTPNSLHC